MDTLRELVARERRGGHSALRAPGDPEQRYDYRRLLTDAWKTGNFLSHLGVRSGRTVGIVGTSPESVLSFLGTAALGGVSRFDPQSSADVRALVAPAERIEEYDLPPGGKRVAYGGPPTDPATAHFERDVWSENPTLAPTEVSSTGTALTTGNRSSSHTDVLTGAISVVEQSDMTANDEVALRAPLAEPGAVVAGIVAPLLAGATVLLPDDGAVGTVAVVSTADAPEDRIIDTTTVL